MTAKEEAHSLLQLSHATLKDAETCRRVKVFRMAVSAAYYASFYAAKSVIALHKTQDKTHKGTINLFHKLAVKASNFPPEIAPCLGQLQLMRLLADYDHATGEWRETDADDAIHKSQMFVNGVADWFARNVPETGYIHRS